MSLTFQYYSAEFSVSCWVCMPPHILSPPAPPPVCVFVHVVYMGEWGLCGEYAYVVSSVCDCVVCMCICMYVCLQVEQVLVPYLLVLIGQQRSVSAILLFCSSLGVWSQGLSTGCEAQQAPGSSCPSLPALESLACFIMSACISNPCASMSPAEPPP